MRPLPEAFTKNISSMLGNESELFLRAINSAPSRALRLNPLREGSQLIPLAKGERVAWESHGRYTSNDLKPGADLAHFMGAYYMQDASAMAPVRALSVKPGMRVLDLCAAPGGKAGQIASALHGTGLLIANEPEIKRARVLSANLERLGVTNSLVTCATPESLSVKWSDAFDAVLVDAPCSGEGMFRRDDDARGEWSMEAVEGCARRQKKILEHAAIMTCPGGSMVYSTCTFNVTENEANIAWFLREHPDWEAEEFSLPGVGDSVNGMVRLWPHKVRGEGHFVARLRRKGNMPVAIHPAAPPRPEAHAAFHALCENVLSTWPERLALYEPLLDGEHLYAVPPGMPNAMGIGILRMGIRLGHVGRGGIKPDHALAMAMRPADARQYVELDEKEARAYIRGESIFHQGQKGWSLMGHQGMPLGFAKGSDEQFKNHLPKALRDAR